MDDLFPGIHFLPGFFSYTPNPSLICNEASNRTSPRYNLPRQWRVVFQHPTTVIGIDFIRLIVSQPCMTHSQMLTSGLTHADIKPTELFFPVLVVNPDLRSVSVLFVEVHISNQCVKGMHLKHIIIPITFKRVT